MASKTKATKTADKDITKAAKPMKPMKPIAPSELLTTEDGFKRAFKSIRDRGASLQRSVHIAACSVLQHLEKHKDVRMVQALFVALPKSYRTNALRDWFMAFGPVTFKDNKPVYTKKGATKGKVKLTAAMDKPFWEFSPEKPYVPLNPVEALDSLIKRLNTDAEKTDRDHSALINTLTAAKQANAPATTTVQ
ncbi:hypothetical protein HW532_20815 [Kaustia mangrovi]|uniref:Uncharacterized protein n=1 Tax=Kaustia mangrovi TaxID=2593653 RepID=A0A7S8HDL1_9HYPH|nr:hypothetical protein [Kaustia mangrovi]QPC44922.1 hypothetical protein HW532_20815 [Kaustia mangrovi]